MVITAITRGATSRAAILAQSGTRRAFSIGVTRPRTGGVCKTTSSNNSSKGAALSHASGSQVYASSTVSPVSWKNVRYYATEGSAPPQDKQPEPVNKAEEATLSRTPLYDFHVEQGAKLVPFAGYEMPLTYKWGGQPLFCDDVWADFRGPVKEHEQVRKKAGLFDVSHMVQSVISGPGATRFMEHLVPSSLKNLTPPGDPAHALDGLVEGPYLSSLSVMLNKNGGIIDDLMVTRQGDESYYIVTNAGRRKEDLEHITRELADFNKLNKTGVRHDVMDGRGLIALQGPASEEALQPHISSGIDLSHLYFGQSIFTTFGPEYIRVHIARGGYTGEDGFEISIPGDKSIDVAKALIEGHPQSGKGAGLVEPVGLAARDSLRLEAGMCLYGHDLSEDVNPLEAGLTWIIGEDRRQNATFLGAAKALEAMALKAKTVRRVGMIVEKGSPAREGTPIYAEGASENDEPIGKVTSGIPSPTLKQNIAMGYVKFGYQKSGTNLQVKLRGKMKKATVTKMPFVKPNYYRQPKDA
ncbi:glycine cleavage system T protein [Cystobasidium minutum MCA 4210]|uniref:glycine cleavage system T protein n=1 Tax=Cystobasidium minutum MCA 4210 TaxID=1397322 RepID=UPI0034CE0ABC|eukprot:jgi/Rhomi1/205058/MIX5887_719_26